MNDRCNSFIDTDIVMKIGGYTGEKLLEKVLCSFGYNLFLHEYLLNEELIFNEHAIEQLQEMINSHKIVIVKESELNKDAILEYNTALQLLATEMEVDLSKPRDHNAGEVRSMAMAFAKDFQYFISDDGDARVAAKLHLQKIDGSYLETIRMNDIITHIREHSEELGISRKIAKRLYLYGANPILGRNPSEVKKIEGIRKSLKNTFDTILWKVQ
jgi:predicted nucleic acid-binding protein